MSSHHRLQSLRLFLTTEHACGYLPDRIARNLVADADIIDNTAYGQLIDLGFRRSGNYIYRPHCSQCEACLSLRIPVTTFRLNRSQQRTWKSNRDLTVHRLAARFEQTHYSLFKNYVESRHPLGGMVDTTPEDYLSFISSTWSHTLLYEFRLDRQLLAVAVADRLSHGLSAVYTFFDPEVAKRGLGTYAILWQIAEAKRLDLPWVYLGYWIRQCNKMAYKANFKPHEIFTTGRWVPVSE